MTKAISRQKKMRVFAQFTNTIKTESLLEQELDTVKKLKKIDTSLKTDELAQVLDLNKNTVKNDEEKPVAWITIHGNRVPIFEGGKLGDNPMGLTHYTPRSVKKSKQVKAEFKQTDKDTFKAKDTVYQSAWALKQKLKKETDPTKQAELKERIAKFEELTKQRVLERKEKLKTAKQKIEDARLKKMGDTKGKVLKKQNDEPAIDIEATNKRVNELLQKCEYANTKKELEKIGKEIQTELNKVPDGTEFKLMGKYHSTYGMRKISKDQYIIGTWSDTDCINDRYTTLKYDEHDTAQWMARNSKQFSVEKTISKSQLEALAKAEAEATSTPAKRTGHLLSSELMKPRGYLADRSIDTFKYVPVGSKITITKIMVVKALISTGIGPFLILA